ALRLKGLTVRVSRTDFPALADDEHYWVDLIGCTVVNTKNAELGVVQRVEDHGAHPILLLLSPDKHQLMIPFVDVFIIEVDTAGRRIVADWEPDY
ncbi:MAG: ribosome maturation factor RimM, partial [Quisquiliibacterium sp.]